MVNDLSTHGFLGANWDEIKENATSYEAQRVTPHLVATIDPFYRPTGMAFGPDGPICVLDFSTPLIGNTAYSERDPGRDHSRGRVWRITSPAAPLLQSLGIVDRPNRVLRYRQDQIDHTIDRMAQLVKDQQTRARTEAVWPADSAPRRKLPKRPCRLQDSRWMLGCRKPWMKPRTSLSVPAR